MIFAPPATPALSIRNLSVTYTGEQGDNHALISLSADLHRGEVFALVGESGSGKSTAGFAVGGLLPPENTRIGGEIEIAGESFQADDRNGLRKLCGRRVGFVFQEPSSALHPAMRVAAQVGESIHQKIPRDQKREKVTELLRSVRLAPDRRLLRSYPHQLSGGMQQRVILAMAMANQPALLIADEPTTALDPTIRKEILQLIRELASRAGSAVLLITHDFGIVSHFTDRVAVLHCGKVVETGKTQDILSNPQHHYTKALIASAKRTGKDSG